jgi:AcrR family transcriptional regulator
VEFRQQGFEAARIDKIAARASVAAGTVYNYFPTKETLLGAVVAFYRRDSAKHRSQLVLRPVNDPVRALSSYYGMLFDDCLRVLDRRLWRHVYAQGVVGSWGKHGDEVMDHEQLLINEQVAILERLQERGSLAGDVNVIALADTIHAIGFFWWHSFLADESVSLRSAKRTVGGRIAFVLAPYIS